jgi:hypothetical protein
VLEGRDQRRELAAPDDQLRPIRILRIADGDPSRECGQLYALASGRCRTGGLSPDGLACFHVVAFPRISSND